MLTRFRHLINPALCVDHLDYCMSESVEPHGERFRDEFWRCTECGSQFTAGDLRRIVGAE